MKRPWRSRLADFFFYRRYDKRTQPFVQMSPFRYFLQDLFEFIFPGFCRELSRRELTGVVDRMGGDGVMCYLSGGSIETCEKEVMGMLRMHEERAAVEALEKVKSRLGELEELVKKHREICSNCCACTVCVWLKDKAAKESRLP